MRTIEPGPGCPAACQGTTRPGDAIEAVLCCLPHQIEVDVEIAVSHAIAHAPHVAPRHIGVRLCERSMAFHHFRGGLADDAHDDGLLGALVGHEVVLVHPFHEAAHIRCGLLYMIDVIRQTVLVHTGCASASTLARNFGGRSPGVSKST
jgi:hypothetical protein